MKALGQWLSSVSLLESFCCQDKERNHNDTGESMHFCLYFQVPVRHRGSQGEDSSRNSEQKPWKIAVCRLTHRLLLS